MTQWYYSQSDAQRGPISEAELKQLLDSKTLPTDTLIWSEGMAQWLPATLLPSFAPSPYASPSATSNDQINWSGYTPSGSQTRPWTRYWARTVDFLLFSLVAGFAAAFVYPDFLEMSDSLVGIILIALYNFYEPVVFAVFGNTPMKAILKIRVRDESGNKLTFQAALVRTLKIWFRGLGLGIPLVTLITHITSYSRLKNQGITSWDQEGGFVVSHQDVAWWRWLLIILFLIGFVGLIALGSETEI